MINGREMLRDRHLVQVIAAPGYGKTHTVREWFADCPVVWSTGQTPKPPPDPGTAAGWWVIDDVAVADRESAGALSAALTALPPQWRVVVLLCRPPAAPVRRGHHRPALIGPAELAMSDCQVNELLGEELGPELATRVHEVTAGWPALVRLAGAQLAAVAPPADRLADMLARPGTALANYLEQEVVSGLSTTERELLHDASHLTYVCAELLDGGRSARELTALAQTGLLVPAELPSGTYRFDPQAPPGPWYRPVPVLAGFVRAHWPAPDATAHQRWRAAADWCREHRLYGHAARLLHAAGDPAEVAAVLAQHGEAIVAAGGGALVTDLIPALPGQLAGDPRLRLVLGEALALVGDNDAALAQLAELAGPRGPVAPAVAWRLAAVHYQRAERQAAAAALTRGRLGTGAPRDEALLLAQFATLRWSEGAVEPCQELAEQALRVAEDSGDDRAIAAARVSLALHAALVGDRGGNAAHYRMALRHAEAAGDAVQVARIRANCTSRMLEESRFAEALAAAGPAVAAAQAAAGAAMLALALVNEAEALLRLGRLAVAEQRYQRAVVIHQQAGSRKVAYALAGLGDLYAHRGAWGMAQAAYEEALRAAEDDGLPQCLVPALAGLARVVARSDPAAAGGLATRAVERATGPLRTRALLAAGWVQVAAGDRGRAAASAHAAAAAARAHRDRAGLAEALELRAYAEPDPQRARESLREAARTWRGTGSRLDADRVAHLLAGLPGASESQRRAGRQARERLEQYGALPPAGPAAPEVVIRTLGGFEVEVAGQTVPAAGWQSRKARDLLRILVAQRGRTVPREELCALLWGEDDPARLSHRLSVALSTLRSVLDPRRRLSADHYLVASSGGLRLELTRVSVDVETFMADSASGLARYQRGELGEAHQMLVAAEAIYRGDFCEDEPYQDWSVPTREEARAAYLRSLRALADISTRRDRPDEAAGYLLRLLRLDRYDEPGHCALVALLTSAGRHGEARRAQQRYLEAMRELGVPARQPGPARVGADRSG